MTEGGEHVGFAEQFEAYVKDMGPETGPDAGLQKKTFAEALGVSPGTVTQYGNGGTRPTLAKLPRVARAMGVDLNWLLGEATTNKWGPEIQQLRLWLRTQAPKIPAPNQDWVDRIIRIIRLLQDKSETCRQDWFMAGILRLSVEDFHKFMAKGIDLPALSVTRFADFCGLPEEWLLEPEDHPLGDPPDLGDYYNVCLWFVRDNITGGDLQENYEWIKKRMEMHRKFE